MSFGKQGGRLVTQNLLATASIHETNEEVSWDSVADLCVLIDLFCLYDTLTVLGRRAYSMLAREGSEFFGALQIALHVRDPHAEVEGPAAGHLAAYLGEQAEGERFLPLFKMIVEPDSIDRAYSAAPDMPKDVRTGLEWVQTLPADLDIAAQLKREKDVHRAVTFLARTFLYVASADAFDLPLTADGTRSPVLKHIARTENNLRRRLLQTVGGSYAQNRVGDERGLTRRITPLAAIVFDRAWPKRSNISAEMVRLRNELRPLRERVRAAEDSISYGNRGVELSTVRKWNKVFEEIERQFGRGEGLLNITSALGFAEGAAGLAMKPENPGAWFKLFNLPVELLRRVASRRTVLELHRLRDELPSSENLKRKAQRLFGDSIQG